MYKSFFKYVFDFYLATILFIIFFPIMLTVYLILYILIGSHIYFQTRPGYMNKSFIIYKFKTLIDKNVEVINHKKKLLNLVLF